MSKIKIFLVFVMTVGVSILAIIMTNGRGKYLLEKIKMELEKKQLKDKIDKLETNRQLNNKTIENLDKKDSIGYHKILAKEEENKKIDKKIENIKKELYIKDNNIQNIIEEIKKL